MCAPPPPPPPCLIKWSGPRDTCAIDRRRRKHHNPRTKGREEQSDHDVVRSPQTENEPRPEIGIAVGIESDLGKEIILLLLVVGDVLQPLALCNHILGPPGMEPVVAMKSFLMIP